MVCVKIRIKIRMHRNFSILNLLKTEHNFLRCLRISHRYKADVLRLKVILVTLWHFPKICVRVLSGKSDIFYSKKTKSEAGNFKYLFCPFFILSAKASLDRTGCTSSNSLREILNINVIQILIFHKPFATSLNDLIDL